MENEINSGELGLISLTVEIDGEPYIICLPQNKLRSIVKIASEFCDGGNLLIKKLGPEYSMKPLKDDADEE